MKPQKRTFTSFLMWLQSHLHFLIMDSLSEKLMEGLELFLQESHFRRKPIYAISICEQQTCRPICISMQSNRHIWSLICVTTTFATSEILILWLASVVGQTCWNLTKTWQIFSCGSGIDEPHHEKTQFCHMLTTKAQISLRIYVVWSAPLLFAA